MAYESIDEHVSFRSHLEHDVVTDNLQVLFRKSDWRGGATCGVPKDNFEANMELIWLARARQCFLFHAVWEGHVIQYAIPALCVRFNGLCGRLEKVGWTRPEHLTVWDNNPALCAGLPKEDYCRPVDPADCLCSETFAKGAEEERRKTTHISDKHQHHRA